MKPKVSALIQNRANTLVLDFPKSIEELRVALLQSGIPEPPRDIFLMDNEGDPIRVKVYGEDELGRHLARIFSETDDLAKVNTVVFLATDPRTELREEMRQSILSDKYGSVGDFLTDVQQMLQKLSGYTESFYFPLSPYIQETFADEPYRVSSEYLAGYEDELMQALEDIRSRDTVNMAQYYNEHSSPKQEAISMDWSFEEIRGQVYGRVDVQLKEPLAPGEKLSMKDWIRGQNSDGAFESFEDHGIAAEDGWLTVSFGGEGQQDFLYDRHEMDCYLAQQLEQGGM